MKKVHLNLPTIHCESCVKVIEMTLKGTPGIGQRNYDTENRRATVEFDGIVISGEKIADIIKNEAGYDAVVVSEEDEESNTDDEEDEPQD